MGGIGSGGSNRKTAAQHKRLGTFQPVRHANRIGEVVDLPLPRAPQFPAPSSLGPAGKRMWEHLWLHVMGLSERDKPLVEACCQSADQVQTAYNAYLEAIQLDRVKVPAGRQAPIRQSPALARALAALKKELRQDLALLGMSAKDRQAYGSGVPQRPRDALVALRRKAPG